MQFMDEPNEFYTEKNEIAYTFIDPPYDKTTGSDMYNWIVKKIGPFYFARYYGWG